MFRNWQSGHLRKKARKHEAVGLIVAPDSRALAKRPAVSAAPVLITMRLQVPGDAFIASEALKTPLETPPDSVSMPVIQGIKRRINSDAKALHPSSPGPFPTRPSTS